MAKSSITKELATNSVTIEVALSRLLIIASDLENMPLISWVENELNGYPDVEKLPKYRVVSNTFIKYSGINGRYKVTDAPLPLDSLLESDDTGVLAAKITDGIRVVENIICNKSKNPYGVDLTWAAPFVYKVSGIQCYSITQTIPHNALENIISTVKTALMEILIQLEKEFGCLDDLDIDISKKSTAEMQQINARINHYIDYSIHIGDNNKIKDSNLGTNGGLDG